MGPDSHIEAGPPVSSRGPRPASPQFASSLPRQMQQWNTAHLPWRISSDAAAAASASALVAPVISIIDRGIIERASSSIPLRRSLAHSFTHLLTRPHTFLTSRPFLLIFSLYFATYFTANTTDTLTSTTKALPATTVTAGPGKFLATSAVNMSLCLYKDTQYAKIFANPAKRAAQSAIPLASLGLFALRDSMTIFASFNLPPVLAPLLPSLGAELDRSVSSANVAQFLAPAGMQLFSTPMHLLGLDLFNRAGRETVASRLKTVGRDYLGCSFARMGRIVPAFGVGGVVNKNVRERLMMGD